MMSVIIKSLFDDDSGHRIWCKKQGPSLLYSLVVAIRGRRQILVINFYHLLC